MATSQSKCAEADLYEPNTSLQDLGKMTQEIQAYLKQVTELGKVNQGVDAYVQNIRNGEMHNAGGILQLGALLDGINAGIEAQAALIGKGYTLRVGETSVNVNPENTYKLWRAKMARAEQDWKKLYSIYKYDICKAKEAIEEQNKKLEARANAP